ncbi:putative RNA-directed DNA polymerase [Aphis craccivora]|uniref:Putative RNA-directed DNA polymerase n=1 Tax=Aphis craccivora TaxID=307492 RepID=A0A6G0XZP3_APHCR|nr:putative RNA-directed DNA polymerase [Aphis craccivora]
MTSFLSSGSSYENIIVVNILVDYSRSTKSQYIFSNISTLTEINYDGYNKNRLDSTRASGGVAIYVKTNYPSRQFTIDTNIEAIVVTIKLTDNDLNICNIYIPNQKLFTETDINNINKQLPQPFIIVGDFNSHNVIWGSDQTDQRGKVIENILENNNIILLNNTELTRLNPINGNMSNIDLSFASTALAQRMDWKLSTNLTSSDHFPITIQILSRSDNSKNKTFERWNLKEPHWSLYTELLESEKDNIKNIDTLSIDCIVKSFTDAITKTAELSIGKNKCKTKKPKVPWWNDEIKNAIKSKNKALNIFKKTKNETDTKLIWNKIRLKRNNKINLIDENNNYLNSNDNSYKSKFIKMKIEKENTPIINTVDQKNENQVQINAMITMDEISYTLKKCKSLSPGPVGIPFIFIHYFEKWFAKTGFSFSTEISNCIIFSRKPNLGELNIKLNNVNIINKKHIKILGITFDSRLTWSPHIKSLKIDTNKALRILKLLSHTTWGSETEILIKIFKSTIQAKLHHGSIIYNSAKKNINKIHRLKSQYWNTNGYSPPWTSSYNINTELNTLRKENTLPNTYKNVLKSTIEHLNDFHEIYTDAFKNDEGVGIAIVKNNLQSSFKLPLTCSIYTAEAVAIFLAIKSVNKNKNQKYIILSDSLSAFISIKSKFNPSDIVIQIQNRLEEAKKRTIS